MEYSKIRNIKDIIEKVFQQWKGEGKDMSMFLRYIAEGANRPTISSKLCIYSFGFLIVAQFLDGLTTKIGLSLGLAEVGIYAMPILGSYGYWGLMLWKFGSLAILGVLVATVYFAAKRYAPKHLTYVSIILTIGCLVASIVTAQVVASNLGQIEFALSA